MAQAIFNKLCAEQELPMIAESAGLCTATGVPVSENSAKVLKEIGIDISGFTATDISDKDMESFDVFAVMSNDHRNTLRYYGVPDEKIHILAEDKGGIFDPYCGSEALYRVCRDEIIDAVRELISKLSEKL